jgi:DNA polymerase epsilon subunit 2
VILLGYLDCEGDKNTLTLEDPTGIVKLDVSEMSPATGVFSLGCIVIVQGDYHDGTVYSSLIGHPPATSFDSFCTHFWKLSTDPFGWELTKAALAELSNSLSTDHASSLILFVSDVWVDVPAVVENFNHLLSQYDRAPPNVLVIAGSFTSRPYSFSQFLDFRSQFSRFCEMIRAHAAIYQNSKIVILPSIHDIAAPKVFPRPPLVASLAALLPEAHFLANPCRIRFMDQTITIFRDDIFKRLSGAAVFPLPDREAYKNMLTTLIDQRHLCPLDLDHAPIAWPYDYAMRLFPQPTVLAVCDSVPAWCENYAGCVAFNPGPFGNRGTFVAYFPGEKRAEILSVG